MQAFAAIATAFYVLSIFASGMTQNIQIDCSLRSLFNVSYSLLGSCTINPSVYNCVESCQNQLYATGQLDGSGNCVCINGTTIDPNFCCSDWQCQLLCSDGQLTCNSQTNRCERVLNVESDCNTACVEANFGSGAVSDDGSCVCSDCESEIMSDERCLAVTSAMLGAASVADINGLCTIQSNLPLINLLALCTDILTY
ncbi:hypothetical protein CHUAL_006621 [Chamberlinius hualienensis]